MIINFEFPIHRREDGSIDHDFYRAEAARMRVAEKKRLFCLAGLQVLTAIRAVRERARGSRPLPRAASVSPTS